MTLRAFLLFGLLGLLVGCGKPLDLPDLTVAAAAPGDFTRFRADLGTRFPADRLRRFDTAVQELELAGMERQLTTAEARKLAMLEAIQGKTVHAVEVLGWQARCARFRREIAQIQALVEGDRTLTPSPGVVARIQRASDLIAKLENDLATAERELTAITGRATAH